MGESTQPESELRLRIGALPMVIAPLVALCLQAVVSWAYPRSAWMSFAVLGLGISGTLATVWFAINRLGRGERERTEAKFEEGQKQLHNMLHRAEKQARDLTRSEQKYREQSRVLQSVLHNMADGLVVVSEHGNSVICNDAANKILDGLAQAPIGAWATRYDFYHSDGTSKCLANEMPAVKALCGEEVERAVFFAKRAREGAGAWLSMTGRSMKDEGGIIRSAVVVITDISAQRENEEKLQRAKDEAEYANRAKSDFLSRMSHELRTPLNAILGFGQLLEMAPLKSRDLDSVDHILKAGRHLLSLINEILDISRIESGRLALTLEPVLLPDLVDETLAMMSTQAAARQIRIDAESARVPVQVLADRQRLRQILINLLSNAVKYNRLEGTITMRADQVRADTVRISVTDTGKGIPADKLKLLFNPFERLGAEQTDVEGSGIGLVVTKRLVEVMAGKIGVESQPDVGTTFWFEIPLGTAIAAEHATLRTLAENVSKSVRELVEPSVLCIEDNPSNLRLVEQILASRPEIRLISATTGEAGLKRAAQEQPQLILLDVNLPDLNGREVLERLRAEPATAGIPVVIVSADATPYQEQRMREAGALHYLTKPLDVRQFLEVVESSLAHAVLA